MHGLWMYPPEVDDKTGDGVTHFVSSMDVGFLDRVACRHYGSGFEMAWWALCRANGVIDPETDTYPGMKLYVPDVSRFLSYIRST